jgi:hypothetical protein
MTSTGPAERTVTRAPAFGKQPAAAADGTMSNVIRSPTAFAEVFFPAEFGEIRLFVLPLASEAATTATATQPTRANAIGSQCFRVRLISLYSLSPTYDGCNYPILIPRHHSPQLLSGSGLSRDTASARGSFGALVALLRTPAAR